MRPVSRRAKRPQRDRLSAEPLPGGPGRSEDGREGADDEPADRAEERAAEWQKTLEDATEDMRRELGVRAVHAQRTKDALDAMAEQIKQQKKHIG